MSDEFVVYGKKADEQIQKTVREVTRRMMNDTQRRARWQQLRGGGGATGSGGCACTCIDTGDLTIDDIETTSQWSVVMSAQTFKQTYGNIIFPAGTYVVEWDSGTSLWTLDIGADLTAEYLDGSDATADTTMDGTLTLEWAGVGSAPSLKLCVDGTIPAP